MSRTSQRLPPWQRILLAAFCAVMGILIGFAAFDLGPMAGSGRNAPRWVVAGGGGVFLCAAALLLNPAPWLRHLAAGATVTMCTLVFAWVAVFGDAAHFVTDDGVFSRETQVLTARLLFGLVALLGLAILVRAWFWYRARRRES